MSSIAQKLCDQICEESPLKPPRHSTGESYKKLNQASNSRYDGRPTRSIIVEKKRIINKVMPSGNPSKSRIVINKYKSKETLKKTFVDIALNTNITGPLHCDNDCVTMVRMREHKSNNCRCGTKRTCRVSAKEIQTFDTKNYSQLDKACAQCVETANCGTQFLEKLSNRRVIPQNTRSRVKLHNEVNTQTVEVTQETEKSRNDVPINKSKINYNFMGARRWALSQYPARGPDF